MPELPEVEHVVRALRRAAVGRRIIASEVGLSKLIAPTSVSVFNRKLRGSKITGVSRRGKFILIELQGIGALPHPPTPTGLPGWGPRSRATVPSRTRLVLIVHLRMTGKFLYLSADEPLPKHAHAIFYLDNDRRLVFRDQRKFGVMRLVASARLGQTKGIRELAPEPLSDDFSAAYLKQIFGHSRRTVKTLLLDQTKVLGLGNIYAAEALFRAGINPFRTACEVSARRIERLHQTIRDVLGDATSESATARISLENPNGFSYGEAFESFWQVYAREGELCFKCRAKIRRITDGGRSTYWCPRCQRR